MVKTVSNIKQIIDNLKKIEDYLGCEIQDVHDTMAQYIARGKVFVAYNINGQFHFAPSRFVGYANNSLYKHESNVEKDGRKTNPAISSILKQTNRFYPELENAYNEYCMILGKNPSNVNRTFWILDEKYLSELSPSPYLEGRRKQVTHMMSERNLKVVEEAKNNFKKAHAGRLFCEICGFDFQAIYGDLGKNCIEAHHIIELSSIDKEHEVAPNDFIMVCSNCHTMLHKKGGTIEKLKAIIAKSIDR